MEVNLKGWLLTDKPITHSHQLFWSIWGGLFNVGYHNTNTFIEKIWTLLHGTRSFTILTTCRGKVNVHNG